MNLLIYVPQMFAYGGIERHTCLIARECARAGAHVAMVTTSNALNDGARAELIDAGVDLHELSSEHGQASKVKKLVWLMATALRLRGKRWDIIYTNGQSGLAGAIWLARNSATRLIHHHHTAADHLEQLTWHPAYRWTLSLCHEIVACSTFTKQQLEGTLGRTDIVFLPYATAEIIASSQVVERTYDCDSVLNFGFVGRLVPTKGIEMICKLSEEPDLAAIKWHIYGSGNEYPESFFKDFPKVKLHGAYQNLGRYSDILQGLDAVVLYSRHAEGMPLSLMEAMAAGLPWIAVDRGGTRELAVAGQNCLLIPPDATFQETKRVTLDMVSRLHSGQISRLAQRRAYDEHISPQTVYRRWFEYFGMVTS